MSGTVGDLSGSAAREEFLRLLIAQVQGQNPLDPVKDTEFIAQLAQFSVLEGIENLNNTFERVLALQRLSGAAQLIGKTVEYYETEKEAAVSGTVTAVLFEEGDLRIEIDGKAVDPQDIRQITNEAAVENNEN